MGMFDGLFGGGNNGGGLFGSAGLYGDLLTQAQQQAIAQRGFAGFLGGLQKSGALDYTVPFISGKVPASFAAGMAGGAAGAADARDQAGLLALKGTELGLNAQQLKARLALMQQAANDTPPPMFGGAPSTAGPSTVGLSPSGSNLSDPRGVIPLIRAAAIRYGHDPETAVKVAGSEGLGAFYGDGGKSGTAFQLYTGGGLGNEFQKETGLDPLDPKNEPAAIDWAMRNLDRTGWTPYHGAAKVGVGARDGISIGEAGNLPAVPNFAGMMTGNQGPSYAPPVAQGGASASPLGLTEGDSIGVGFQKFGGLAGNPVGGRNPQAVLDNISANLKTNPNYYSGKTVLLSSGTMNDPDGSMTGLIPQQIAAIQQAGGKVVLAGADTGKFAPRNAALAGIAKQSNVPFAGPLPTDNVHPGPDGYSSYVRGVSALMRPQQTPIDNFNAMAQTRLAQGPLPGAQTMPGPVAPAVPPAVQPPATASALGGINPDYIAWAQKQARILPLLGIPVPPQIAEAAKLPLVGPTAAATAAGNYPFDVAKIGAQQQSDIAKAGPIAQAQQEARVGPETAIEQARPRYVPGVGLVVPGQMAANAPAAPQTAGNGALAPGVLAPTISPAQEAFLKGNIERAGNQIKEYHAEGQVAAEQVGNARAIADLLPRVRMGWGAGTIQEGARILSSLGASPDTVNTFLKTDPNAGDELNKLFLKFSADAVRNMGAREPGSVIALFAKAFPNLETMPNAAVMMNNALMMQARFKQDRANAAEAYDTAHQQNAGQFGTNYHGLQGFESDFAKSNDPRDYWRAAAAMSNEPDIAWKGVGKDQAHRIYDLIPPGAQFVGGDGKLYPKPNG